jgi:rhodanese-related sulfurtransferase
LAPSIEATAGQANLNEKPKPEVLKVREPSEYAAGHLAGSTLIPLTRTARQFAG